MNEEEFQLRQIRQATEQGHPKGLILGLIDILIGYLKNSDEEDINVECDIEDVR